MSSLFWTQWPSSVMATTPGAFQAADGRELLAGDVLGDGAGDKDIHDAFARRAFADERDGSGVVNRRRRVGHADDGSESAARRRRRAGGEVLLGRLARFAQVDVQINQPRTNNFPLGVKALNSFGHGKVFADGGNFAVNDENFRGRIEMTCGINHPTAGQQQRIHRRKHRPQQFKEQEPWTPGQDFKPCA